MLQTRTRPEAMTRSRSVGEGDCRWQAVAMSATRQAADQSCFTGPASHAVPPRKAKVSSIGETMTDSQGKADVTELGRLGTHALRCR